MNYIRTILFTTLLASTNFVGVVEAQISGNASTASDSVAEILPYRGHLDVAGQVYDGYADFQFAIYTVAVNGTPAWTSSEVTGLRVYAGEFAVDLGAIGPSFLTATTPDGHPLFQTDTLYLEVSVRLAAPRSTPGLVKLGGRQRLLASPYAMTARQAEALSLTSNLTVGQSLTCDTATFAGNVNTLQAVTATGAFSATSLSSVGSLTVDTNLIAAHYRQHAETSGCAAGTAGCASRGFAVIDTAIISYGSSVSIFVPTGATALCGLKMTKATMQTTASNSIGGGCTVSPVGAAGGTSWTLTAAQGPNPFQDLGSCQMSCLVMP